MKSMNSFATILFVVAFSTFSMAGTENTQDDVEAIKKMMDEHRKHLLADDIKSWANLYAENNVKMPPGEHATTSRDEMYEGRSKKVGKIKIVGWDHELKEIEIMGNRAYTWAVYKVDIKLLDSGRLINNNGKWLMIYKKEPDGRWLITHDCYNRNTPPKQ